MLIKAISNFLNFSNGAQSPANQNCQKLWDIGTKIHTYVTDHIKEWVPYLLVAALGAAFCLIRRMSKKPEAMLVPEAMLNKKPEAMLVPEAMLSKKPEAMLSKKPEAMLSKKPEAMLVPEAMLLPEKTREPFERMLKRQQFKEKVQAHSLKLQELRMQYNAFKKRSSEWFKGECEVFQKQCGELQKKLEAQTFKDFTEKCIPKVMEERGEEVIKEIALTIVKDERNQQKLLEMCERQMQKIENGFKLKAGILAQKNRLLTFEKSQLTLQIQALKRKREQDQALFICMYVASRLQAQGLTQNSTTEP